MQRIPTGCAVPIGVYFLISVAACSTAAGPGELSTSEGFAITSSAVNGTEVTFGYPSQSPTSIEPLTGDPKAPTQQELFQRGYLLRPDPLRAPDAYAHWLEIVSKHYTVFPHAKGVLLPKSGATQGSAQWSGGRIDANTGTLYGAVQGCWQVPLAVGRPGISDYSALFVGLGGANGSTNLTQAGTEQDNTTSNPYYGWVEWTEFRNTQASLQNVFTLSPGDQWCMALFVGDSNGNGNPNGQYSWYDMCRYNHVQGCTGWFNLTRTQTDSNFTGSAEWIMERTTIFDSQGNPTFPPLANYGSVQVSSAAAQDYGGTWHTMASDPTTQVIMVGGCSNPNQQCNPNDILSNASGSNSTETLTWVNWQ
jgi:hypothetical protein